MRPRKQPIDPARIRTIPANFSWIDRRFIGDHHVERLERDEILLYFFLVAVADREGLSFYADATIGALLKIPAAAVVRAREGLVARGLVAFAAPLTQVLALDDRSAPPSSRTGSASAIGEVLRDLRLDGRAP